MFLYCIFASLGIVLSPGWVKNWSNVNETKSTVWERYGRTQSLLIFYGKIISLQNVLLYTQYTIYIRSNMRLAKWCMNLYIARYSMISIEILHKRSEIQAQSTRIHGFFLKICMLSKMYVRTSTNNVNAKSWRWKRIEQAERKKFSCMHRSTMDSNVAKGWTILHGKMFAREREQNTHVCGRQRSVRHFGK